MDEEKSEKDKVLDRLQDLIETGDIERAEVYRAMRQVSPSESEPTEDKSKDGYSIKERLAGPVLVFFAVVVLCVLVGGYLWWEWNTMSRLARVSITLGMGLAVLGLGNLFDFVLDKEQFASSFYTLSGLLLPVGIVTWYYLYNFDVTHPFVVTQITGILFLLYLGLYFAGSRTVLLELCIFFGSGLFVGLTDFLSTITPLTLDSTYYYYRAVILGIIWMVVGGYSNRSGRKTLSGYLFALGSLFLLGAALMLGGEFRTRTVYWEALFPLVVMGVYVTGIRVRSRFCLVSAAFFLVVYLARLSNSFFRPEMGLPASLVIFGFGAISVISITTLVYGWIFSPSDFSGPRHDVSPED